MSTQLVRRVFERPNIIEYLRRTPGPVHGSKFFKPLIGCKFVSWPVLGAFEDVLIDVAGNALTFTRESGFSVDCYYGYVNNQIVFYDTSTSVSYRSQYQLVLDSNTRKRLEL